jgi:hypothetical protein
MKTKRVGRLFFYTTPAGYDCVVNLDAIACTSRHREGGTIHGRLISGVHMDIESECGDAFLAALSERAAEVG